SVVLPKEPDSRQPVAGGSIRGLDEVPALYRRRTHLDIHVLLEHARTLRKGKTTLRTDIVLGEDTVLAEEVGVGVLGEPDQRSGRHAGVRPRLAIGIDQASDGDRGQWVAVECPPAWIRCAGCVRHAVPPARERASLPESEPIDRRLVVEQD